MGEPICELSTTSHRLDSSPEPRGNRLENRSQAATRRGEEGMDGVSPEVMMLRQMKLRNQGPSVGYSRDTVVGGSPGDMVAQAQQRHQEEMGALRDQLLSLRQQLQSED